jgi:FAD synthase
VTASGRPLALGLDPLPEVGPAALTMGVFDGVHRGHRALLEATRTAARSNGLRAVALVFDPHPDEVLKPGSRVPRLAPLETNLRRIEDESGIDQAIAIRFDAALRERTAEEFLAALSPAIELRVIVMSPESAFGRGRGGTVQRMRELGSATGFEVVTVAPVMLGEIPISSMRIREALAAGDLARAAAMGYQPLVVARVAPDGILEFGYRPALPAAGTYRAALRSTSGDRSGEVALQVEVGEGTVRVLDPGPHAMVDGQVEIALRDRV